MRHNHGADLMENASIVSVSPPPPGYRGPQPRKQCAGREAQAADVVAFDRGKPRAADF